MGNYFQRLRIQVGCELLTFFHLIWIFFGEEIFVDSHLGIDGVGC